MKRNDYLKSNNVYYLHSLMNFLSKSFFWIQKITLIISKNWLENQQKTVNLMIYQSLVLNWLNNKHYQTLKDLENNLNDKIKQLKEIFPDVFQDGILNFQLLKQHLEQSENIAETNVFGLYWNGKNKASINSRMPLNSKTLKPLRDQSLNFDEAQNIIIEGDNLEALKILQKAYFNQVDVIYIDPPYNTGNDFVYDDDYSQSVQDYKKINNLVDEKGLKTTTNQKTSGRFHTNWLNMIYPRLILARSLLKDDGVIFISIDDNEQARLKLICDEIFGEDNFLATLIWQKLGGPKNNTKHISQIHDYLLAFAKNKNNFNINLLERNDEQLKSYKNPDNDPRGSWQRIGLLSPKYNHKNDYEIIFNDQAYRPSPGHSWMFPKKKLEELILDKRIYSEGKMLRRKMFLSEVKNGVSPTTILNKKIVGISQTGTEMLTNLFEEKEIFHFPKPVNLIKFLINLHSNESSLTLDFFSGSGTTAQAVMELNQEDDGKRQYILVQLPEKVENDSEFKTICDITRARIERSIAKYQYNDKGFKYFKVASTNFQFWKATTKDDSEIIGKQLDLFSKSINEQNDYEAILYELILKSGMRLDWNVKDKIVNKHQFWIDEQIDNLFFLKPQKLEQVLEIIKKVLKEKTNDSDTKVYISEAYFTGQFADQNKLNLCEQIKQFNKQESKQIKLMVV